MITAVVDLLAPADTHDNVGDHEKIEVCQDGEELQVHVNPNAEALPEGFTAEHSFN